MIIKQTERQMISPDEVLPGEILYADLHFLNSKNKKVIIKEQVISKEWNNDIKTRYEKKNDVRFFSKYELKEEYLILKNIDVIVRLGYKNKKSEYLTIYND